MKKPIGSPAFGRRSWAHPCRHLVRGYLKTLVRKRADQTAASRRLGFMAGQIKVPDDFDSTGGLEIEKMFGEHA